MHSAKEEEARVTNMMTQLARSSELCSTQEGEAGGSEAHSHLQLYREFKASQRYVRLCLKK